MMVGWLNIVLRSRIPRPRF